MSKNTIISIGLVVLSYFMSTGASYALFSEKSKPQTASLVSSNTNKLSFDESLPKTEACPLNGQLFSKPQRQWWEKHRPLGVMIENHQDARPQSGLSFADVIYEAVAEGGITRFLAVFYCQNAKMVGPVRSARTYFLDFISEYGDYPLYAHVGGANTSGPADALGQIADYGWNLRNDLSQFNLSYPTFKRIQSPNGHDVATEHTMFSTTEELWKVAENRKLTNVNEDGDKWNKKFVSYNFKEDAKLDERATLQTIHLEPWEDYKQYAVDWTYDKENNIYKRVNGGVSHVDAITNKQLTAKNIVVLSMVEGNANDGYERNLHLLYRTKGAGKAYIFMDGKKILGTWQKENRTGRTLIYDNLDAEIKFNRGNIWFEIVPTNGVVNVR